MKHTINECWVFVAMPEDEDEGIPALKLNDLVLPMVASDETRVKELRLHAEKVAKENNVTVELRKFTNVETLEVFKPE